MRITVGNQVEANIPGGVVINSGNVTASIPGGVTVNSGHVTADVSGSVEITNASINANVTGDVNVASGNINITDSAERILGRLTTDEEILLLNFVTITTNQTFYLDPKNASKMIVWLYVSNITSTTTLQTVISQGCTTAWIFERQDTSQNITSGGLYVRVVNIYAKRIAIQIFVGGTSPSATITLVVNLKT